MLSTWQKVVKTWNFLSVKRAGEKLIHNLRLKQTTVTTVSTGHGHTNVKSLTFFYFLTSAKVHVPVRQTVLAIMSSRSEHGKKLAASEFSELSITTKT